MLTVNVYICIRETGKTLEKKLKEHRGGAVKRNDMTNGIAEYAWKTEQKVDWEAATVKQVETRAHYTRRGSLKPSTSRSRRLLPTLTVVNPSTQYGTPHLTPSSDPPQSMILFNSINLFTRHILQIYSDITHYSLSPAPILARFSFGFSIPAEKDL